ncbi:MAG: transposase [Bacteroidales bacterium]|nr:transposase [Bacteroidales bacterium]
MKQEVTTTVKVRLMTGDSDREMLVRTAEAYRKACDFVSGHVFDTGDERVYSLNGSLYPTLRSVHGLKAQMAQSVLKTVVAKYASVRSNGHERTRIRFRALQYDLVRGRDWSCTKGLLSVNTLDERLKLQYYGEFDFTQEGCTFGTARLVVDPKGRCFLHIPVTRSVDIPDEMTRVVGIDRGIRKPVVAYDGRKTTFVQGSSIKTRHARFLALRRELQQRRTPSARHRLKTIGRRENRWMCDVNHRISKALADSNPAGTLFVLEDLGGIRGATERVRTKDRYVSVSWSYYDLEQKLMYKASLAGQKVVKVDPRYTSQRCPVCGVIDSHSRDKSNHVYKCSHCGYRSDDDRIGAMNLYQLGIEYLKGTEHPRIQSPSGRPGGGGCSQSPRDVTPRPKGRKKVGAQPSVRTTGQSQAH